MVEVNACRLHLKPDDPKVYVIVRVVGQDETQVVVDEGAVVLQVTKLVPTLVHTLTPLTWVPVKGMKGTLKWVALKGVKTWDTVNTLTGHGQGQGIDRSRVLTGAGF